jgi:hypothetical protein
MELVSAKTVWRVRRISGALRPHECCGGETGALFHGFGLPTGCQLPDGG